LQQKLGKLGDPGHQRISGDTRGYQKISGIPGDTKGYQGIPRIQGDTRGYQGISEDIRGYQGIPRDTRGYQGYQGILGDTKGYQGIPGDTRGYQRIQGIPVDTWGYHGIPGDTTFITPVMKNLLKKKCFKILICIRIRLFRSFLCVQFKIEEIRGHKSVPVFPPFSLQLWNNRNKIFKILLAL